MAKRRSDMATTMIITPLEDLVDRVLALSRVSPEDLAIAMDAEEGAQLLGDDIAFVDTPASKGLRAWRDIVSASPAPLTDEQFRRFLAGNQPLSDEEAEIDIYGGHLA